MYLDYEINNESVFTTTRCVKAYVQYMVRDVCAFAAIVTLILILTL
jgi:hypothetical protein